MTPHLRSSLRLLAAVCVLGLATSCADDGPDATAGIESTATATVTIERSRFGERELVVPVGTTVTFVNLDEFAHTVTSREDAPVPFDSGELVAGETFEITFDEPGTYDYFCRIHPTMRATVIVT